MRTIEPTTKFKRDWKRELKGPHRSTLSNEFPQILQCLARDKVLPERLREHALTGEWKDHRDCHVRPDLVLIYRKPDDARLQLVRLGSHAELGL